MKRMNSHRSIRAWLVLLLIALICHCPAVRANRTGWQHQEVNWHMSGGTRIKGINYPNGKRLPRLTKQDNHQLTAPRKKLLHLEADSRLTLFAQEPSTTVIAIVIDSPPVAGFVPWIAVTVTDRRSNELEFEAVPRTSIVGRYLTSNPKADYAIGIFDTGASAHVMGNANATRAGLFDYTPDLITSNLIEISGATSSVVAWVSQPLALFIDGLGAIEPNGLLLDTSGMVGETNVSIAVAQNPGTAPDLPTVIGTPLSVFFTTVFHNDRQITITRDSNEFTAPDIRFYESNDPCIPTYSNIIPLELRPLGAVSVQYIPSLDDIFDFGPMAPGSPSVIIGNLAQSLFFVHSIDLYNNGKSAIDKDRFMLDTGAQITVIGSRIAARLKLDPTNPDFEVEIQDVTGTITMEPGFYIDSIDIPAIGEWLSFTNVPVILLDVASPEGGTLDGIIGMNLFVNFNLVLRNGGLFLQDDPKLEFEHIPYLIADIAPENGDRMVDIQDLIAFADAWLATPTSPNWNPNADMAPQLTPDDSINFLDFVVFAEHWLKGTAH